MKKFAILVAAVACLAISNPVVACPDHPGGSDQAPRTAEKDKKETPKDHKSTDQAKAKEQPKADKTKEQPAKDAKPAEPKKPDKVSSR